VYGRKDLEQKGREGKGKNSESLRSEIRLSLIFKKRQRKLSRYLGTTRLITYEGWSEDVTGLMQGKPGGTESWSRRGKGRKSVRSSTLWTGIQGSGFVKKKGNEPGDCGRRGNTKGSYKVIILNLGRGGERMGGLSRDRDSMEGGPTQNRPTVTFQATSCKDGNWPKIQGSRTSGKFAWSGRDSNGERG